MSALDLVFRRLLPPGGMPLDLVFGGVGSGGGGEVLPVMVTGTSVLGQPVSQATAVYDNRLPATVSTMATARHQAADRAGTAPVAPWGQPDPASHSSADAWQSAGRSGAGFAAPWDQTGRIDTEAASPWQYGAPVSSRLLAPHQVCTPVELLRAIGWQLGTPQTVSLLARHQVADALQTLLTASAQQAAPLSRVLLAMHQVATPAGRELLARWQSATRLIPPGLTVYVPPGGGAITPHPVSLDFVFACPPYQAGAPLDLVFGHVCGAPGAQRAPLFILPARFYMAVHSLQAWRLPDMLPVPVLEFTYRAERGSFGWAFEVLARRSAFDDLAPVAGVPAMLRVEFDGIRFDMVVDERGFDEAFGGRATKITCSSVTRALAVAASQRVNAAAATAQQLALQALDGSGISLDWGLTDWLVPAGAWSHSGTPLAAVQAIAEAAGGYLQSHRYLPELQVRHPYPDLTGGVLGGPWNWGSASVAPDVELASGSLVTVGVKDVNGPDLNGVYLSGVQQGLLGLYKRDGSAADKLAEPVTDPLMTALEVVRQRGRAIIGAAGQKQSITATLPVLTGPSQPGVIDPGKLIQVNAAQPWRAMVRGVSGTVKFGAEVRQTLDIERHLGA